MKQHIRIKVDHPKYPASTAIFNFSLDNKLCSIQFNQEAEDKFKIAMMKCSIIKQRDVLKIGDYGCRFTNISELDLSFENFWKTYNYKLGHKKKAAKTWDRMDEEDKILAMSHIRKYDHFIQANKIKKLYPETYLNQRRWEN